MNAGEWTASTKGRTVSADTVGMSTRAAPKVTRAAVEYVIDVGPGSTVVRDLATGRTFPHPPEGADPFAQPTWIVLTTHDEVMHHARDARGDVARIVRAVNRELYAQHARGEVPTLDELAEALAALSRFEAEIIDLGEHAGWAS